MDIKKIGIIGGGFVGGAVLSFFKGAKVYDKFKQIDPLESVLLCDVIFVCVPTPYEKKFDRSALDDVFENIGRDKKERIVVVKSTSVPGTTDYFQEKYPHLLVLFNPEFLTQSTAKEDFNNPDKQIVGYTKKSECVAEKILSILPEAPYKKIMPAKSAELVKYAVNSFYATKVIFANMIYDVAEALEIDYNTVKEAFVSDKRICDSHFDVLHSGYRGYGGKCLPKDVLTLRDFCRESDVNTFLLDAINNYNEKLKNG